MSDKPRPSMPRGGRVMRIALALSLALNLLIVGLVAGVFLGRVGPDGGREHGMRTLGLGPFALALPREERAEVLSRIDREGVGRDRREIGRALRDLQDSLRDASFDREAAEDALRRARGAAQSVQAHGHAALLDHLADMAPEDRAELADRLARALRRLADPARP